MPGGAALARAYGIAGFYRPGKAKPPPGDVAEVRLMPGGATLAGPTVLQGFVGRVRRSRHPAMWQRCG